MSFFIDVGVYAIFFVLASSTAYLLKSRFPNVNGRLLQGIIILVAGYALTALGTGIAGDTITIGGLLTTITGAFAQVAQSVPALGWLR
ncbi:MAG: hypothetical protein QW430_12735 [Metallosphaera sp.]|uniref:hypothetical protein n=1 Tax=Metallosphaera sp. TaxID=2020860 RepID=UPI00316791EC